jgi:uncharacterized membrane protein
LAKYSKLIVAIIGAVLIGLDQFFGISIGMDAEQIVGFAVPILTAFGVWAVPNTEA